MTDLSQIMAMHHIMINYLPHLLIDENTERRQLLSNDNY